MRQNVEPLVVVARRFRWRRAGVKKQDKLNYFDYKGDAGAKLIQTSRFFRDLISNEPVVTTSSVAEAESGGKF